MSELIEYLKAAKSPYHAVSFAAERLKKAGFEEVSLKFPFELKKGGAYFCIPYPTSLFAFRISENVKGSGMHISCAHTDSPTFKVKPSPDMGERCGAYRINVEPYGGSLKRTWFDRALGVAGVVYTKTDDPYMPERRMFDSNEPWFVIPSLAPHMDREIEEKKLDPQKEVIPLFVAEGEKVTFTSLLASKLGVSESDILDYDLELYIYEEPQLVGPGKDVLVAQRTDNIASCAALTEGLIEAVKKENTSDTNDISIIALYNNEEIGSRTKQGADSNILNIIIDRIFESDLFKGMSKTSAAMSSRILSVDGAQAAHPNYPEKADETAKVFIGKGVVLKTSASQRYVTDPEMGAIFGAVCKANDIPYQVQANRSGAPGGQTLGPIVSAYLPIPAADLGVPTLAMHSAKETISMCDYDALKKLNKIWLTVAD